MPEIKHVFNQGKMNKDLDERLVPNGQYRHGLNIQVSSSEGSDVGTVQNILGNTKVSNLVGLESKCVGAIADDKNNAFYWFVKSHYINRILEYKDGIITPVLVDVTNSNNPIYNTSAMPVNDVLKFTGDIITGINIIDNLLFWTDNNSEPKKINIDLCKQGTDSAGDTHTLLVVPERKISTLNNIPIREEHITVVKKSPKTPLTLNLSVEDTIIGQKQFAFADANNDLYQSGDTFTVQQVAMTQGTSFNVGSIVLLLSSTASGSLPEEFDIRLEVVANISGTAPEAPPGLQPAPYPSNSYKFRVLSVDGGVTAPESVYNMMQGGNELKFFENKFVRLSYRYKYQDGEYSCFGPFSQLAFVPSAFDYQTKLAYNIGMENHMKKLVVSGFVQTDTLETVTEIEILYKESNSPLVYSVDKLKYTDASKQEVTLLNGQVAGSNHWKSNSYEITSDLIYAVIPSNQLLRPFDNVPKKALAQEITGSRIVYANYEQNYDILNDLGDPQKPIITASVSPRFRYINFDNTRPLKSLKSLRQYQVGIVYVDKYGRETPVFSNEASTFNIPKNQSPVSNKIVTTVSTKHPSWAEFFKFYIKETSNEYYNLALSNVYLAEDGNLWLSFPSSERNKIDEETFLILKKARDSSIATLDDLRYKVIAIENEAPEFVKTIKKEIVSTSGDPSQTPPIKVFFKAGVSQSPQIGSRHFVIDKDVWTTDINSVSLVNLVEIEDDFSFTFYKPTENLYSKEYKVTDITTGDDTYKIVLEKPIDESDSWIYPDLINPNAPTSLTNRSGLDDELVIIIHKFEVENKPEFEGKFFVKIYNDLNAEKYILTPSISERTFETLAAVQLYNFSDTINSITGTTLAVHSQDTTSLGVSLVEYTLNVGWSFKTQPFLVSGGSYTGSTTNLLPTTGDVDNWADLVDIDGDGIPQESWFIDNVHFRGEASLTPFALTGQNIGVGMGGGGIIGNDLQDGHGITITQDAVGSDVNISMTFDWAPAVTSSIDRATRPNFYQGIYTDFSTGQQYLEISFSKLGSLENKYVSGEGSNGPDDRVYYSASNGVANSSIMNMRGLYNDKIWEIPQSQDLFVNQLIKGSLFRLEGDENNVVYEINDNPIIFRRYNHTSFGDWEYSFANKLSEYRGGTNTVTDNSETVFNDLIRSDNRRLTYRLPIKVFSNGDLSGDILSESDFGSGDSILNTSNATLPIRITFLKDRYDEANSLDTDNPAIFETEPKESIDLDIYYEASKAYPISYNTSTSGILVSVGDTIATENSLTQKDTKVKRVLGNVVVFDKVITREHATSTDHATNGPDVFTFIDQDGGFVKLRFSRLINPTTLSTGAFESTKVEFLKEVVNEYGLPWTNCYSFGNGVESNRIRDDFNQVIIDKGAKVSAPIEDVYKKERRASGLIYSGLYNSISGVNNLNQFIQAEKITKDLNPTYGSIQKLFSRNTDLIALCEDRIIKILSNKDAVFNADGNTNLTATNKVLGQAMPFNGDFGISKNPESFAKENFRSYFTDKQRGVVLRLSMDGLTPISDTGMSDYFSDNLKLNSIILGSYDGNKNEYNLTLTSSGVTASFDEKVKGWTSFKSFVPEQTITMSNDYYTFNSGDVWKHHAEVDAIGNNVPRNNFYGNQFNSSVEVLLNDQPSIIKSYKTLNYEGSQSKVVKEVSSLKSGYYNLKNKPGWYSTYIETNENEGYVPEFIEKEGKWFNFIKGKEVANNTQIDTELFTFQGLGRISSVSTDLREYHTSTGVDGCTDPSATNYDPLATRNDGSCTYLPQGLLGCMDPTADNYDPLATLNDQSSCLYNNSLGGCMDPSALNYNASATIDDGSCIYDLTTGDGGTNADTPGCMDPLANNYDSLATIDNGSCTYDPPTIYGCTDPNALNYSSAATDDDGSCMYHGIQIQDETDSDVDGSPYV